MRRKDHATGMWIEAMGWPERLLWVSGAIVGSTTMMIGPYEFTIGLQGKIFLATLFLCLFWAAACIRAKYLNEIADTPEHFLRFANPEVMRDVENKDGCLMLTALQFRVHLTNKFDRPITYTYEVFDSICAGSSSNFPDKMNIILGPELTSGRSGARIKVDPPIQNKEVVGRFRWRVKYWTNEKRKFVLEGAMQMAASFDSTSGSLEVTTFSWLPYDSFTE